MHVPCGDQWFLCASTAVQGVEWVSYPMGFIQPQPPPPPAEQPAPIIGFVDCPTELLAEIAVNNVCVNKIFKTSNCDTSAIAQITLPCLEDPCQCDVGGCICQKPSQLGSLAGSSNFPGYFHFGTNRENRVPAAASADVAVNAANSVTVAKIKINISIGGVERTIQIVSIKFKDAAGREYSKRMGVEVNREALPVETGIIVERMENSVIIGKKVGRVATDVTPIRLAQ